MLSFLFFSFTLIGCNQSVTPDQKNAEVRIDVETGFDDDLVKIIFDNKVLLNETITTNYSISAAWLSGNIKTTGGWHKIDVDVINAGISKTYIVNAEALITVRVNFDRKNKEIIFDEYKGILFRD